MENLLNRWEEYADLFSDPVFPMFDYDGTLTPIVERPEDAKISESMRDKISRLVRYCPVGIVSGRALKDLRSRVGLERVYYSGNHGYEIQGPDLDFVKEEAREAREAIEKICNSVESRIGSIDGALVENKGYTASVHYRMVDDPEKIEEIGEILEEEVSPYTDDLVELSTGKKIFELGPKLDWDKGKAVSMLLNVVPMEEATMPVYVGDDVTDEYAFNSLKDIGIGVVVSEENRESAADFRLNDVDEVEAFLERLIALF